MSYTRFQENSWASQTSRRNHQRLRLPFSLLLLLFSFIFAATSADKSVLFIHRNKSNGPAVVLYDKSFQAALTEGESEQINLYNEYTELWLFAGGDYGHTLNDLHWLKYRGQHFDLIALEFAPALDLASRQPDVGTRKLFS